MLQGHNTQTQVKEISEKPLCSVCIASYKRPYLLQQLLDSLMRQQLEADVSMEIIVVDNDAAESARPVAESYHKAPYPLIYSVEARKNISHARNHGVALARGEYLLFIDDDETAHEQWVMSMLQTARRYHADGVVGPVFSCFAADTPEWIKTCYLFNRPRRPTGQLPAHHSTANCLLKAAIFKEDGFVFDERYGVTGGEDSHLFKRLYRQRKRFVSADEACVSEYIPPERTQIQWMLKRAYRTGNLYGRISIELAQKRSLARLDNFFSGLGRLLASSLLLLIFSTVPEQRWHWLLKSVANWGRVLSVFNVNINGY